jgi:Big-like domain-containing protein
MRYGGPKAPTPPPRQMCVPRGQGRPSKAHQAVIPESTVVTVKAGTLAVCTIILVNAAGNCSLTPQQLAVGEYQITATYNSDATHARSVSSPPQIVSVIPALNRFRHPEP